MKRWFVLIVSVLLVGCSGQPPRGVVIAEAGALALRKNNGPNAAARAGASQTVSPPTAPPTVAASPLPCPDASTVGTRSDAATLFGAQNAERAAAELGQDVVAQNALLPDLQTRPPYNLRIDRNAETGQRRLWFATTVWNSGDGPLELEGIADISSQRTRVTQRVYAKDGLRTDRQVGDFVYHPEHRHWHVEDFSLYELWSLTSDNRLENVVASSGKLTFCIMDVSRVEGRGPRQYGGCNRKLQGISVGWGDTYSATTPGQSLSITLIADGTYALRATADPSQRMLETDDTNNAVTIYIRITGDRVQVIQPPV